MKNLLIKIVLFVVIIVLGYLVYDSIMEPVKFQDELRKRERVVVQNLKDIRDAQTMYKNIYGTYTKNFDTLIEFVKTGEIPVIKRVQDPNDTTFTISILDTLGYISVMDTLFGAYKRPNFKLSQLKIIPFSNPAEEFSLDAGEIVRGGLKVNVFEAKAAYKSYLQGMDEQAVLNLIAKKEDIDKYPGLKVGSMMEPSTDGNWE